MVEKTRKQKIKEIKSFFEEENEILFNPNNYKPVLNKNLSFEKKNNKKEERNG